MCSRHPLRLQKERGSRLQDWASDPSAPQRAYSTIPLFSLCQVPILSPPPPPTQPSHLQHLLQALQLALQALALAKGQVPLLCHPQELVPQLCILPLHLERGQWQGAGRVCEPCPTSSFTGENSTLPTPAPFQVWRRQPLARDQGPRRIPSHTAPVWSGYLVLLRGSPTEPGVLIHEAGILILGFSQLQFLRDQRSSGEGAWHPHSSPLHTEDHAPPVRPSSPTWSLHQPGKEPWQQGKVCSSGQG